MRNAVHRPEAVHAKLDATADRIVGMTVSRNILLVSLHLFNDGSNFIVRILGNMDGIRWRGDTTGRHELNEVRSMPQFLTHRKSEVLDPIDDLRAMSLESRVATLTHGTCAELELVRMPFIAMPAGLAQRSAAEENARPFDPASLHSQMQADIPTAGVTHCRESARQ